MTARRTFRATSRRPHLWYAASAPSGVQPGFHLTDLQGDHDHFVGSSFRVGTVSVRATVDDVTDGSMWMEGNHRAPDNGASSVFDVYRGTFSGQASRVGTDAVALAVGPGTAGWVTTNGQVFVQSATGAPPQRVKSPLDAGCRVALDELQSLQGLAVTGGAVALEEACGSGKQAVEKLVAFDLSGRRLVEITGGPAFNLSFGGNTLLFQASGAAFRYDLVSGTLSQLTAPKASRILQPPRGAGSYVLWYDGKGGQVAKIPG